MESGLRAAMTQLQNRQPRFGRRLTNALPYAGRTESTILLEETETLDVGLLQEEEAEAKAEAEKERPGLTMFTDGSRLGGILSSVEEGPDLGGHQGSYGLQPGDLRLRVRRSCKGTGIGGEEADHSREGHDVHRRPGRYQTDGFR